jgi:hypothetical protein
MVKKMKCFAVVQLIVRLKTPSSMQQVGQCCAQNLCRQETEGE